MKLVKLANEANLTKNVDYRIEKKVTENSSTSKEDELKQNMPGKGELMFKVFSFQQNI